VPRRIRQVLRPSDIFPPTALDVTLDDIRARRTVLATHDSILVGKYSETLMNHVMATRNGGAMENTDLTGHAGAPGRGPWKEDITYCLESAWKGDITY
jgi:hypothetical protein